MEVDVKKRLTDGQRAAIPKMRALGMTMQEIGDILGVTKSTICHHLHPEWVKDPMKGHARRWGLVTGVGGEPVDIKGLRRRVRPKECELCGKTPKRFIYHRWGNDLELGVWICYRCHTAVVNGHGSLLRRYLQLRHEVQENFDKAKKTEFEVIKASWSIHLASSILYRQQ